MIRRVDLNYDCLRAIVFEINSGESFRSAIEDLNIVNLSQEHYDLTIFFENGSPLRHILENDLHMPSTAIRALP